jgi:phosphatidylserine decarboxylase
VIGVIKMGSQVTLVLNENVEVVIKNGEKVIEGETIIGFVKKMS